MGKRCGGREKDRKRNIVHWSKSKIPRGMQETGGTSFIVLLNILNIDIGIFEAAYYIYIIIRTGSTEQNSKKNKRNSNIRTELTEWILFPRRLHIFSFTTLLIIMNCCSRWILEFEAQTSIKLKYVRDVQICKYEVFISSFIIMIIIIVISMCHWSARTLLSIFIFNFVPNISFAFVVRKFVNGKKVVTIYFVGNDDRVCYGWISPMPKMSRWKHRIVSSINRLWFGNISFLSCKKRKNFKLCLCSFKRSFSFWPVPSPRGASVGNHKLDTA